MTEAHEPYIGGWWRFNRYEVTDGRIRPARRAKLEEYDPWEQYQRSRDEPTGRTKAAGKRSFDPPYLSLMNLLKALPYYEGAEGDPRALKPGADAAIVEWCSNHGLLGLLPQRATLIALTPIEQQGGGAVQMRYVRTSDRGWIASSTIAGRRRSKTSPVRQPDPPDVVMPHAIVVRDDVSDTRPEPLSSALVPFFPDVRAEDAETFPYPLPLSRDFWRAYAEPVVDFIESAQWLALALRMLDEVKFPRESDEDPASLARVPLRRLNHLVAPISPSLHFIDGEFHPRWGSPSLIASFAMMSLLDLEQRRVRACLECGRLFVTDAYQTRFCSPAHANRVRKRKHRARLNAPTSPDDKTVG